MLLKNRLKTNPWLVNKKYILSYLLFSTVTLGLFIAVSVIAVYDEIHTDIVEGMLLGIPLTIIFYSVFVFGRMLSVNFIINNHRHTALFLGILVAAAALMLFLVRGVVSKTFNISVLYPPSAAFVASAIHIGMRAKNKAEVTLFSLGVFTALLGLALYMLVSFFLNDYLGVTLFILGIGVVLAAVIFGLDLFMRKKIKPPKPSLESLNARFEKYLNTMFRRLPAEEMFFILREQLSASLTNYAELNLESGADEYEVYAGAIDSLGDYSAMIAPYKKNILALIVGSSNQLVNIVMCAVLQFGLTYYYMFSMESEDWLEGLIIFAMIGGLVGATLFALRIIGDVRNKNYKLIFICCGAVVICLFGIVSIFFSREELFDTHTKMISYISGAAFAAAVTAIQIIFNMLNKINKIKIKPPKDSD